jgi:hypothetical protein
MRIRLKYRQGSFPREIPFATKEAAVSRAGHLMSHGSGCSLFEIVDESGKRLLDYDQIRCASDRMSRGPASVLRRTL